MKKYDSYKDSGIEWIGVVPENWNKTYLKYCMSKIYGGGTPTTSEETYWSENEADIPWVAISDISSCDKELYLTKKKITEEGRKSKNLEIIPKGTLLLSIFASLGKTVRLGIDSTVNQAILGLEPNEKLHPKFLEFLLVDIERYISKFSSSSTQENLNLNKIKNLFFYIPNSIEEQTKIINFLDHKTNQIDHLISKKEQFIQLLEEERVAVINQAVTKGLDPNVSMRDSGIEWLGEIPEHWEVKRIKHTTYVKGRIGWKGLRSDEFLEFSDSYVVTGTDFDNGNVKWDTCYQVPMDRYEDDPFIKLKNNDLLITKDGTIGKIAIVKDMPKIATLNSGVFLTRPQNNEYLQEYMYWILYSDVFKTFYDYNKSGSTIQHLYQNVFNEFKYTLPSLKEQTEIVKYLDKKKVEINQIKHKAQHEIELLKEYKTALISEVVTGKVDVRNEKLN